MSIPVIAGDDDLAARVDTARKLRGTSPFVGIATVRGTVMIRREVLRKSLSGLRVLYAELITSEDDSDMIRGQFRHDNGKETWQAQYRARVAIRVYAVGERVKATRLYTHQEWKGSALLASWQRAEQRKYGVCDCREFYRQKICSHVATATRPKMDKYQKAIAKLEKAMPREWRPENPTVSKYEAEPASDSVRRQWREWHMQRDTRRAVMAIARRGQKDYGSARIYAEVSRLMASRIVETNFMERLNASPDIRSAPIYAVEVYPVTITKWGELTAYARERKGLGDLFGYLKRLWEFCGLREKPYQDHIALKWGAEHYREWLKDVHRKREIESMIAGLKAEAAEAAEESQRLNTEC
jgi:hypothetical protein